MSVVIGIWEYKEGFALQQNQDIYKKFPNFLFDVRPARVLEIGTGHGGFSLFLRDTLNELGLEDVPIMSFDVVERACYEDLRTHGVEVIIKNLFDADYSRLEERKLVQDYVQSPGVSLVLCDGGNKKMEFNIISPLLKEGDFIMAHDYAPNSEYFEKHIKGKIWDWCEIEDSHVEQACKDNNLAPYDQQNFAEVVWLCRRKRKRAD